MYNNDITEIVPHLFISNWFTSNNPNVLYNNQIKAVITLETLEKPNDILNYQKLNNIEFLHIKIPDDPNANIYQYFDLTYNFIENKISKGENVLVHCYAGVSRSATIVLNYILRNYYKNKLNIKMSDPYEVLNLILHLAQQRRPIINPNKGFLNQLLRKNIQYSNQYLHTEYFCMRRMK